MSTLAKNIRTLEARVAEFAGRQYSVLVGKANTALYLALCYLRQIRGPGEVILSPIVCSSVVQTIIYAGFTPRFVDITLPLCTIDPTLAAKAIGPETRAILAVHIFGHSADMASLSSLADQYGLWLIEDAAQSIGGTIAGRRHGSWGDISLYSFGGSKIISAGGGGALVTDDQGLLAFARRQILGLPPLTIGPTFALLSLSHRNLVHGLVDLLRVRRDAVVWTSFANLLNEYRSLYLYAFPEDVQIMNAIANGLDHLEEQCRDRQRRVAAYRSGLAHLHPQLRLPDHSGGSDTIWRFTMIISDKDLAARATAALRKAGLHASNHYWSVAELLYGKRDLPNADFASPRLLNLWVEPATTMDDVQRTIDVLNYEFAILS